MGRENIDVDHLEVTGNLPSGDQLTVDDVMIVVNQAYGPTGASLVGVADETFDGFPAITLLVRAHGREHLLERRRQARDVQARGPLGHDPFAAPDRA